MRSNRYWRAIALATGVLSVLAVGPAQGEEITASADEQATASVVDDVGRFVEQGERGFAGMTVVGASRLDLYWHRQPPAEVGSLISDAARRGVKVSVRQAPYAREHLSEARARILADPQAPDAGIVSAVVETDGTGLTLEVAGPPERATNLDSVRTAGVPVQIIPGTSAEPMSRWRDLSPFSGGAAIKQDASGIYCSTAFGVHRRDNPSVRLHLTAAHCVAGNGELWTQGGGALVIGEVYQKWIGYDAATLRPVSAFTSTGPNVYTQGADLTGVGTGEVARRITGRSFVAKDQFVCTNGALTGQRCSIRITEPDIAYYLRHRDGYSYYTTGVRGKRDDGEMAAGEGDSGGPVMRYESTGARAMGVISGGGTVVSCQVAANPSFLGPRTCFSQLYYTDINRIIGELNLEVNTN